MDDTKRSAARVKLRNGLVLPDASVRACQMRLSNISMSLNTFAAILGLGNVSCLKKRGSRWARVTRESKSNDRARPGDVEVSHYSGLRRQNTRGQRRRLTVLVCVHRGTEGVRPNHHSLASGHV